jgi:DNA-3-methyladenine glycosylase II
MACISLEIPTPFSFSESLSFLDRGLDDCMHRVFPGSVKRVIAVGEKPVLMRVAGDKNIVSIQCVRTKHLSSAENYVREWLDTDRELGTFYKLLKQDADLAFMTRLYKGFHMVGIPDLFECLVWCVMGQQINLNFAYTIKRRFVEKYGRAFETGGGPVYLFPDPATIADVPAEALKSLQLTGRKCEYIKGIARLVADGAISKEKFLRTDEKSVFNTLMEIHGVGEWTANYVMMKSLRLMNAVPWGDIGVHQALHRLKGIPLKNNRSEVEGFFDGFEGWKTYMVYYLWRTLR